MTGEQATTVMVESRRLTGIYDMRFTEAIVDHPRHGRLLIREGFGGMDRLEGGAYRWRQGMGLRLKPDDTFETLDGHWGLGISIRDAALNGDDPERPILEWHGGSIAGLAKKVGL